MLKIIGNTRFAAKLKKTKAGIDSNNMVNNDEVTN